jgi:hypothetical protein
MFYIFMMAMEVIIIMSTVITVAVLLAASPATNEEPIGLH